MPGKNLKLNKLNFLQNIFALYLIWRFFSSKFPASFNIANVAQLFKNGSRN